MDSIHALFDSQFIYALGWTIVHSFWQSLLVFVLLTISLLMSKRSRPEVRYWLSMIALVCCLVISIKTFIYCYQDVALAHSLFTELQNTLDSTINQHWWTATFKTINPWLDYIVLVWCIGFVFQGMRFAFDIAMTQRLKCQSTSDLPEYWNSLFIDLARKLGVSKSVSFLHSTKIVVPCVIGHLKPVVLLPLGILSQLPQSQIEAIMLHELAHIKRHDYMINILQSLVKVLFFFNPCVLKISKNIDIERENICDDLAVKVCGDPLVFANSLSQFADVTPVSQSAIAATKDKYLLLARVKRLFSTQGKLATSVERLIALFCAALLGLTLNVNAKSQPSQMSHEPSVQPSMQLPAAPLQDEQPAIPKEEAVTTEAEIETPPQANTQQIASVPQTTVTALSVKATEATEATEATKRNSKVPEFQVTSSPQRPVKALQPEKPAATYAARDYIESEVKAQIQTLNNSSQETKKPNTTTGRVFAHTSKFNMFSLESPVSLENINQLIFAPISTSKTQFLVGELKTRNISNEYFSEIQHNRPTVFSLNNADQSILSNLSSSLITQIRIKDVKMSLGNTPDDDSGLGFGKSTHVKRTGLKNSVLGSSYNSGVGTLKKQSVAYPNQQQTNDIFKWLVEIEVIFVHADSYEYVGYATKTVRINSSDLDATKINQPRSAGSRTNADRNADMIKNVWDVLIEGIQNDVYQVATAIKNKEIKLTSGAPSMHKPSHKDTATNKDLASQYFRVKNSELEEFIISSTDSLDAYTQTTYSPITSDQAQLESKQDGWNYLLKLALYHLSNQPTQSYMFATNNLAQTESSTATDNQNLMIQIDVKQMEVYSRSANRNIRTYYEENRGSNYNRGATATGTGLSPSKEDVGGATVRKEEKVMPSAFDSKLYIRGQFEITLVDPHTHKVIGHAVTDAAVNPKHSAFKKLAQQIEAQNLEISREEMLVIALVGQVKTQLHNELQRVKKGDVSVEPIQLSAEQTERLTDAPLKSQHKSTEITVAHLAY